MVILRSPRDSSIRSSDSIRRYQQQRQPQLLMLLHVGEKHRGVLVLVGEYEDSRESVDNQGIGSRVSVEGRERGEEEMKKVTRG